MISEKRKKVVNSFLETKFKAIIFFRTLHYLLINLGFDFSRCFLKKKFSLKLKIKIFGMLCCICENSVAKKFFNFFKNNFRSHVHHQNFVWCI